MRIEILGGKKIFRNMLDKIHPIYICFKLIFLFVIGSLIFSSVFLSGCIEEGYSSIEIVEVSYEKINKSLNSAEKWLTSNLREKGCFNYIYELSTGEYPDKNNMIRQLMASRLLAEFCQTNSSLETLHQKNLDFVLEHWYEEDNETSYIFYNNKSKLGAIAMALRTLIYSPFFDNYKENATKLANSIFSLQNSDGSFEPWFIAPDDTYDKDYLDYLLTFYSGEAILSLVEMYIKTNDSIYLDTAVKSQDFYIDKYVVHLDDNYYPSYVPWHTQSLNKLYKITDEKKYADAIMILNDKLLEIQDTNDRSTLGRFYDPMHPEYGAPHSSSDGVYTEGLAYAYEVARLVNDTEHQNKYKIGIILGVHNLVSLQYDSSDDKIDGAIRYNIDDYRIRIDTTQHTIDAFKKILDVFGDDSGNNWNLAYNIVNGTLVKYSQNDQVGKEGANNAVWYALAVGTILSIILLFIIYLVIRKKQR